MDEDVKRNTEIYLKKEGYRSVLDTKPSFKKWKYAELAKEYGISERRVYKIVVKYRLRYNPTKVKNSQFHYGTKV